MRKSRLVEGRKMDVSNCSMLRCCGCATSDKGTESLLELHLVNYFEPSHVSHVSQHRDFTMGLSWHLGRKESHKRHTILSYSPRLKSRENNSVNLYPLSRVGSGGL